MKQSLIFTLSPHSSFAISLHESLVDLLGIHLQKSPTYSFKPVLKHFRFYCFQYHRSVLLVEYLTLFTICQNTQETNCTMKNSSLFNWEQDNSSFPRSSSSHLLAIWPLNPATQRIVSLIYTNRTQICKTDKFSTSLAVSLSALRFTAGIFHAQGALDIIVRQRLGKGRSRTCVCQITERKKDSPKNLSNDRNVIG